MVGPVVFFGASRVWTLGWAVALWLGASAAHAQSEAASPHEPPPLVIRALGEGQAASTDTEPASREAPTRAALPRKPPLPTKARTAEPAPTPEAERPIRVALSSGYGLDLDPGVTSVNPFGVSFGVRGGYMLGPVYVGTRFLFFLGESRLSDGTEKSADEWLLGFEGGYGFRAGPLVLRPELGFGLAISSSEGAREGVDPSMPVPVDTSSEDPYLELGVALELDVTRRFLIGVEGRSAAVFGKTTVYADAELFALLVLGTLGYRF